MSTADQTCDASPSCEVEAQAVEETVTTDYINAIPDQQSSPFGSYPNILKISDEDRESFHPVIKFPEGTTVDIRDMRTARGLASEEDRELARRRAAWWNVWLLSAQQKVVDFAVLMNLREPTNEDEDWNVGRYDENRLGMYVSEMFEGSDRTLHLGSDIGGPVGTEVYAFCDGVVHSAGYNPDFGDYGNVVVVEHHLPNKLSVWALYGHMDSGSTRGKFPGQKIKKGQVIGRLGDCHENGGWFPHLHFQLAINPPETHDMPGTATLEGRKRALTEYPDPRYILGPIH